MLRIGFAPALDRRAGGVFQYSATMMKALAAIARDEPGTRLVAFMPEGPSLSHEERTVDGWREVPLAAPSGAARGTMRRLVGEGPHRDAWRWWRRQVQRLRERAPHRPDLDSVMHRPDLERWWRQQGVDVMIFPQPHPLAFEGGVPCVVAIHDLQHRLQPEFREVSADGEWERREYVFRNCVRAATQILVDSDLGKEQLLFFYGPYGVSADRVRVLPFLPASTLPGAVPPAGQRAARERYGIPERYMFYPAQFWPHKNHARIVEALERLKRSHDARIPVVFCGSRAGALRDDQFRMVMDIAAHCGVADQLHVLDYIPDDDLAALYAGAVALVMPTFFGPTNIPVLEAWSLGCPVLTSDLPGIREQVADAAILVDPRDVGALADGMLRLWSDEALGRGLAERGTRRLAAYTVDDHRRRLRGILAAAADIIAGTAAP
jgi:glycosyltransferase involved in cell wall biosynthesis